MKQMLALILVLLMLAGCGTPSSDPTPAQPEQETTKPVPEEPANPDEQEAPAAPEDDAPIPLGTFSAETLTGETVTEAIFAEAELTVINVWATYCGPCKTEMPILGQLNTELEGVQFLGIATDVIDQTGAPDSAQIELALELMNAAGCQYPCLILNQSLAYLGFAGLSAVPATLFVDNRGNLVGQGFYGALDETGWRQVIQERLEMVQG